MAVSRRELTVDEIRSLLAELGQRLDAQGVEGQIYIVGGAAIALEFDRRRVTVDIDALFHPSATVRAEAEAMALKHDLPTDWLSDRVRAFVPAVDPEAVQLEMPGLIVAVAPANHLIAMKLAAYRPGTDQTDLELLFEEANILSAEQAADLAIEVYGEASVVLPSREELILSAQAILDRMS